MEQLFLFQDGQIMDVTFVFWIILFSILSFVVGVVLSFAPETEDTAADIFIGSMIVAFFLTVGVWVVYVILTIFGWPAFITMLILLITFVTIVVIRATRRN